MMGKGNRWLALALVMVAASLLSACGQSPVNDQVMGTMRAATSATPPPVPISEAKFSFSPVTGAPAGVLISMSAQIAQEAQGQQINIVPSGDPAATYVVKGYLSAVGDVSGTILVYVWDIFDTTGRRVHRISGQETSTSGSASDPWAGVDKSMVANVARRTISSIVAWGKIS